MFTSLTLRLAYFLLGSAVSFLLSIAYQNHADAHQIRHHMHSYETIEAYPDGQMSRHTEITDQETSEPYHYEAPVMYGDILGDGDHTPDPAPQTAPKTAP